MSSESLHEAPEALSDKTRNMHRAIVSLMEELEAIDWYGQRAEACTDPALREVLVHNKNEEIEHAVMTLEWIRRNDSEFDRELKKILFTNESIVAIGEPEGGHGSQSPAAPATSLAIGSLRKRS